MGFLKTIGESIAAYLKPILEAKSTELIDAATEAIKVEIRAHVPVIIEAVVKAVAATGANLAKDGVDKVTDMIPGQLDDQFIEPIVNNLVDEFKKRLGF